MKQADICLVLEGTYPYVPGGVSSWVHNLILGLPQFKFSLLVIVPNKDSYSEYKFKLPPNIVLIHEIYLHEYDLSEHKNSGSLKKTYDLIRKTYKEFEAHNYENFREFYDEVMCPETRKISPEEIFRSEGTWNLLVDYYEEKIPDDTSFIDYFWAWRYSHLPLLKIFDDQLPKAHLYHTISTGYASLAAIVAKFKYDAPVVLTEHGIYTNERRIEVEQSEWIYETIENDTIISERKSPIKDYWITFFDQLGRLAYHYSDEIVTLSDKNRAMQLENGADPKKCQIIPNGIKLSRYPLKKEILDEMPDTHTVGFVGRVVPIKDVITLIKAFKIVSKKLPNAVFKIMGPTEEDPEYYDECEKLVEILGLADVIEFTGRVDLTKTYHTLDVVVLTSISEGQPLVILEANCCGVPCVASDVGACSELLNGRSSEDILLGPSGLITPVFDPQATAAAIIKILTDIPFKNRCQQSGFKRVEKYYNEYDLNFAYSDLYDRKIKQSIKEKQQAFKIQQSKS